MEEAFKVLSESYEEVVALNNTVVSGLMQGRNIQRAVCSQYTKGKKIVIIPVGEQNHWISCMIFYNWSAIVAFDSYTTRFTICENLFEVALMVCNIISEINGIMFNESAWVLISHHICRHNLTTIIVVC